MNFRKWMYFSLVRLRGQPLGMCYHQYLHEYNIGISPDLHKMLLIKLIEHCKHHVPYYARIIESMGDEFNNNPIEYLKHFPILTKNIVRCQFDELRSTDLSQRKWYLNSTGGSTGEPVQFIQDREYAARSGAVSLLFSKLVGKEIGECEVTLWGSARDIVRSNESFPARVILKLTNTTLINSVLMTPDRMREFISILNTSKPKLVVSYAEAIYCLAKFAESEGISIIPQQAIMTAAGKLFPFMRRKIEEVFHCKVFDRYGSREVGDIACEIPGINGLWIAPWGNYIEIVDPDGNRVANGTEGDILVTSLTNYAMPLIRYKIGDRGVLSIPSGDNKHSQAFKEVTGRMMDYFRTQNGAIINPGYFMANLYFRDWIAQYQIIQKSYENVTYRIVRYLDPPQADFDEIIKATRNAMGPNCEVIFEFVEHIPPSASGKYRFLISEVSE